MTGVGNAGGASGLTDRRRQLLGLNGFGGGGGGGFEAMVPDTPVGVDDITGRVEDRLTDMMNRVPAQEVGDPADFRRALSLFLDQARRTIGKLVDDPDAPTSPGDDAALEAIIRTDGSRPSLLVQDDAVNADHPLAADWKATIEDTRERMRARIRAVGRVEPASPTSRSFFGTCWVVDRANGLALTNRHVVELAMVPALSHLMQRTATGYRVLDGAFVDFVAEANTTRRNRFKVVEAIVPAVNGPRIVRLDAAVLRLEPTADGETELPEAIPLSSDLSGPSGGLGSYCAVGVPGPPRWFGGVREGVDWAWVNSVLFGNRYGVKRLAIGETHRPLGSIAADTNRWVFGHDLTTLGGSSGSPMVSWIDADAAGFGLHFAGANVDTNYAHAIGKCVDGLRAIGAPI